MASKKLLTLPSFRSLKVAPISKTRKIVAVPKMTLSILIATGLAPNAVIHNATSSNK